MACLVCLSWLALFGCPEHQPEDRAVSCQSWMIQDMPMEPTGGPRRPLEALGNGITLGLCSMSL